MGDLLVVRLKGVLTAQNSNWSNRSPRKRPRSAQASAHAVGRSCQAGNGTMVHEVTGVKVQSLHHDISTMTGEELVVFTLVELPLFREPKKEINKLHHPSHHIRYRGRHYRANPFGDQSTISCGSTWSSVFGGVDKSPSVRIPIDRCRSDR